MSLSKDAKTLSRLKTSVDAEMKQVHTAFERMRNPVIRTKHPNLQYLQNLQRASTNRPSVQGRPGGYGGGRSTRSHPELGSESPQRQWYFGLSRGRVGRRQAFLEQKRQTKKNAKHITIQNPPKPTTQQISAGWSSPVARQAHNLKVTGSNPVPATKPQSPAHRGAFGL